jgi:hypothetical protein
MECLLIGLGISLVLVVLMTSSRVGQLERKVATLEQTLLNHQVWHDESGLGIGDDGELVEKRMKRK